MRFAVRHMFPLDIGDLFKRNSPHRMRQHFSTAGANYQVALNRVVTPFDGHAMFGHSHREIIA